MELSLGLKTWFADDILQQGLSLLRTREIQHFISFRQGVGVVFNKDAFAGLLFERSDKTGHGYVVQAPFCSLCKPNKRGHYRCLHVAAAAMLGLITTGEGEAAPLSHVFQSSPWSTLGRYVFGLTANGGFTHLISKTEDGIKLRVSGSNNFYLTWVLSNEAAGELAIVHPEALKNTAGASIVSESSSGKAYLKLRSKLIELTRSDAEKKLAYTDIKSRKEKEDLSFWQSLCRLAAIHYNAGELRVNRDPDNLFFLVLPDSEGGKDILRLTLPRLKTLELLLNSPLTGFTGQRLPAATPYSRVFPADDRSGDLIVEHKIRLADGRSFRVADLLADQYGSYYYLAGEGFLPLKNPPSNEVIRSPEQEVTSLFQFTATANRAATGFTVAADNIRDFLKMNREALRAERHEVDECYVNSEIVQVPERLELTSFEEKDDWCYLAGFYGLGNRQHDLGAILEQGAAKKDYVVGDKWLSLQDTPLAWFHNLGTERICRDQKGNVSIRLRPHEMLALSAQMPEVTVDGRKKKASANLRALLEGVSGKERRQKIATHLRDYQQHGAAWLDYLAQHRLGGILADDMGLGKTHQALAFIALQANDDPDAHFLIACPASVLLNWRNKAEQYFPELDTALYYGPGRDLDKTLESRVIITTYGVMRNDMDRLAQVPFKSVLFDEMQQLKNPDTLSYLAATQLTCDTMIGLTGTPIENSLLELEALFDLCLPGLFANSDFYTTFIARDSPETRAQLSRIIRPFMLRRTRKQVLDELPDVIDDVRGCELHEDQVGLYREIIEENRALMDGLLEKKQVNTINVLAMITRLKQVCNHPALLEGSTDWALYGSGKWELWKELIAETLESGMKVVVFSQYTGMLDIMGAYLASAKLKYCEIRGKMTPTARQKAIDSFADEGGPKICLASLLAGGTGIDLTAAQVVIHYDRWWNPAKEEQATARVHRMGQRRVVQVIKLYNKGTLEEKMHQLIEKKKALSQDVIAEDDASIMKQLGRDDLLELFRFTG